MSLGKTWRAAAQIFGVSMVALMVLAASAAAATVSVAQPCFVSSPKVKYDVPIMGSGFDPEYTVHLSVTRPDGHSFASSLGEALADGTTTFTIKGVYSNDPYPYVDKYTVTLDELGNHAETQLLLANRGVEIVGKIARRSKVHFKFVGLNPNQPVYAHYTANGKEVFRHELGTTHGPCGSLEVRDRIFPAKHSRHHKYTIQFDNSENYSAGTQPRIREGLTAGLF